MTSTATEHHCEIVPIDRHDSDGVTVEWGVCDPWHADKLRASGFQSPEAAIEWATANGYTPDLQLVAAHRLEQSLTVLGPWNAAKTVVSALTEPQLIRFAIQFRRSFGAKIEAADYWMDLATAPRSS